MKLLNRIVIGMLQGFFSTIELIDEPKHFGKYYICGWGGFPDSTSGKEPACQLRRHRKLGFDPWIRKIPLRKAWQPTQVFLPGKSHGQRSLADYGP